MRNEICSTGTSPRRRSLTTSIALMVALTSWFSAGEGAAETTTVIVRKLAPTPTSVGKDGSAAVGLPGFEVLTNAGVLDLHGLGLGDPVIAAMLWAVKADAVERAVASIDPNDPASPHAPGTHLYDDSQAAPVMTRLEPAAFSQQRVAGLFAAALTGGLASAKLKGVLAGSCSWKRT